MSIPGILNLEEEVADAAEIFLRMPSLWSSSKAIFFCIRFRLAGEGRGCCCHRGPARDAGCPGGGWGPVMGESEGRGEVVVYLFLILYYLENAPQKTVEPLDPGFKGPPAKARTLPPCSQGGRGPAEL